MSHPRLLLCLGLLANLLFWASVLGFAAVRPEYSHFTDAVSELGSVGAPNMWGFNVLAYITPGLLATLCGFGLIRAAVRGAVVSPVVMAIAGAGLLIAGVFPADMSNMRATTTILHVVGVSTGLLWPPTAAWAAFRARREKPAFAMTTLIWFLAVLGTYALYAVFVQSPGLVQRVTLGTWLAWYPVAALALSSRGRQPAAKPATA